MRQPAEYRPAGHRPAGSRRRQALLSAGAIRRRCSAAGRSRPEGRRRGSRDHGLCRCSGRGSGRGVDGEGHEPRVRGNAVDGLGDGKRVRPRRETCRERHTPAPARHEDLGNHGADHCPRSDTGTTGPGLRCAGGQPVHQHSHVGAVDSRPGDRLGKCILAEVRAVHDRRYGRCRRYDGEGPGDGRAVRDAGGRLDGVHGDPAVVRAHRRGGSNGRPAPRPRSR